MMVIGIIGGRASGKDTAARYIAEKYNGVNHSHSEILDDVLKILSLPNSRENADKLVGLRAKFGENTLINALNKKIKNENANLAVVTGIRFQNELDNIRQYPDNKLIYIETDLSVRYERQKSRGQRSDDNAISFQDFVLLEQSPTQKEIPHLGEQADFKIHHNGSPEELYPKLDEVLKGVIK